MSSWINKRKKNGFYRKAKRENYRSRASYKLIQLNEKYRFLNNVNVVIDVCCAPGSWIQVIQSICGKNVFILGIDINKIKEIKGNVIFIQHDITDPSITGIIKEKLPDNADIVIADCSMKTSGVHNLDVERQNYLVECTFEFIVKKFLKKGGHFVSKIFQGPNINNIKRNYMEFFKFVRFTKPKASLSSSREMYLICKGFFLEPNNILI
ncbi:MAG: SAM-dependent methyltransferase [Candidatus Helarchaeota archaeon]